MTNLEQNKIKVITYVNYQNTESELKSRSIKNYKEKAKNIAQNKPISEKAYNYHFFQICFNSSLNYALCYIHTKKK